MRRINDISIPKYTIILWIVWIGTLLPALSQEGVPFFRNYTTSDYQAHNRSFDVACDSSGIVYFANFEGILYFNGEEWNKIFTPGISRVTRLYIDRENQVWVGGYNYIGKITRSGKGKPVLKTYLSDQETGNQHLRVGEVSHIEEVDDSLHFLTQSYQITVRKDSLLSARPFNGATRLEHTTKRIRLSAQTWVSTNGNNGLIFTDYHGNRLSTLTEENGLCSNTINDIETDHRGSLWGVTDNGIFRVNTPSFYSKFTEKEGLKGEVTTLYRYKEDLYAGTLHGLFRYNKATDRFEKQPAITQSCWQLKESPDGSLFAATSNGLFKINGQRIIQLNDYNTFSLIFDPRDPRTIYTGEIDGIFRLKGEQREKAADIKKAMKLEVSDRSFWAETLYGELYRFGPELPSPVLLDSLQGLKAIGGNKLYRINGHIHVFSQYGVQRWNPSDQRFEETSALLDSLMETNHWWPGIYASSPSGHEEWITRGDGKNLMPFTNKQIDSEKDRMLVPIKNHIIRTLYLEKNGISWVGGDFGLIKFDPNEPDGDFSHLPEIHIRGIRLGNDSTYFEGYNGDIRQMTTLPVPRFGSSMKNFEFLFTSDANDLITEVEYAYYLEGYESRWSPWQTACKKEYTNLSFGTYTLHVKAKDAFGRESKEASFTFTILKPFYLKWYSLLAYLAALIVLILLFFKWRTRKLLQENMRLEEIVGQRTRQIREQRDEIAEKSQKLEVALQELNEAQDQLIRQEKMATVAKLTQGLIDRILNPLNYIINFSHLSTVLLKDMKEDVEDEEENITEDNYEDMQDILQMLHTHLTKIEEHGNSTSRILKAMEEMLSEHNCHFRETDINRLIKDNLDVLSQYYQKELQTSEIQIDFKPLETPLPMDVDPLLLGKVLMSMMLNSIHALHKKKSRSDYKAQMEIRIERKEDHALIYLHDNGIGIEESILDKIFDPFFTTKTTSEAAGVGLYLSREIILSHNGSIQVKSEKDEYTKFILSLPIHQSLKSSNDE